MLLQSVADLENIPTRIVSLVPSQTELLHFLGLETETVGITKFCMHPANWRSSKIIIGGTKNVDTGKVRDLHPDLVIANKEENVKEQVEELAKYHAVWLTDVNNLAGALQMIQDIGLLTGTCGKAAQLVKIIERNFLQLTPADPLLATCYLIWRNPHMTVGGSTFINDMLSRCGLQNIFSGENRYPEITVSMIKDAGCRLLLLSSEPYPFKQQHVKELQTYLPETKIMLVDGEMFSWYGSRLLQTPGYFKKLIAKIISSAGE